MEITKRAIGAVLLAALLGVGCGRLYLDLTGPRFEALPTPRIAEVEALRTQLTAPASRTEEIAHWSQIALCSVDQLRALAEQLPTLHRTRSATCQLILQRLAKYDPEGALALASQLVEKRADAPILLDAVLLSVAEVHPAAAQRWVEQASAEPRQERMHRWLLALSAVDPPAAFRAVAAETAPPFFFLTQPAARWALADPPAALAAAQALPEARRPQTLMAVLGAWVQTDRAAVVRWLQEGRGQADHFWLWRGVLLKMVSEHPAEAAELAAALPARPEKDEVIRSILYLWAQSDLRVAQAWVDARPSVEAQRLRSFLVEPWIQQDPAGALAFVFALPGEEPLGRALRAWREIDLRAARVWLAGLPAGEARERSIAAWASGTSVDAAAAWVALLEALPPSSDLSGAEAKHRLTAIRTLAGLDLRLALRWAAPDRVSMLAAISGGLYRDPEMAAEALQALRAEKIGAQASREGGVSFEEIMGAWARRAPLRAAEWLRRRDSPEGSEAGAFASVAREWAQRDPSAAWRWTQDIPAAARDGAREAVIVEWIQVDLEQALATLPPERAEQETLRNRIYLAVAEANPAVAARLAENLTGDQRPWILERIARHWLQRDPTTARPWVRARQTEIRPDGYRWLSRVRPEIAFSLRDSGPRPPD